jgi:hypothetical protein
MRHEPLDIEIRERHRAVCWIHVHRDYRTGSVTTGVSAGQDRGCQTMMGPELQRVTSCEIHHLIELQGVLRTKPTRYLSA